MKGKFRKVDIHFTRTLPGLARGAPLGSPTYQIKLRKEILVMKRNKVNRKRDKAVLIRMNESEYATLNEKLKQTGATQQAFIISAIKEAMILSVDGLRSMKDISKDFANLLRQVQGLANNVNQLAHWANQTGLVP